MDPRTIVREARREDARAMAEVIVRTWREAYRGMIPDDYLDRLSVERNEALWKDALSRPRSSRYRAFAAFFDDRLVGVVSVGPCRDEDLESTSTAEIYAIYVLPDYWGRGIGRALVEAATGAMRAEGSRVVILWVLETNARTRRFYEAAGWRHDGAAKDKEFGSSRARVVRYRIDLA